MFEQNISEETAKKILSMGSQELRDKVTVKDRVNKPVQISGIEIELEWSNPDILIISHAWIDPKLRGNKIGYHILDEIINQVQRVNRIESVHTSIQASNGATESVLRSVGFAELVEYENNTFGTVVEGRLDLNC